MDKLRLTVEAVRNFPEDPSEISRWFDQFEAVAAAVALPADEWKAAIILKLKPNKFLQISQDMQNGKMFPENEEDRHYKWFKESIIHILGEDRTLQKACTKLIRRRLSPNENLNHYRIEFDVLWAEFLSTFENILAIEDEAEREKKLETEKHEFFVAGLPPEIQFSVRTALANDETVTTENLRVIAQNARRSPAPKFNPKRSKKCYYCEEDYFYGHKCKNREPRRSERLQNKSGGKKEKENSEKKDPKKEVHKTEHEKQPKAKETNVHDAEVHVGTEVLAESIQFVQIQVNGSDIHALVDSGSSINVLSESTAKQLKLDVTPREDIIINKFSSRTTAKGIATVTAEEKTLHFIIVDDQYPACIVGQPALRAWKAIADWNTGTILINGKRRQLIPKEELKLEVHTTGQTLTQDQESKITQVLTKYETVFTPMDKYTDEGPAEFSIKLRDDEPCREAPRRRPQWKEEILENLVNEDTKRGILEPCRETDYVSEPVLVPKENNAWRLCIDYRKINAKTVTDPHPLPRIDSIIDMMSDKKYFSKIDCERGYHQLRIKPEDRPKTAFRTKKGIFMYKRLPMGLKNAAPFFQRKMERILDTELGHSAFVYLDDIIICSKTFNDHLEDIDTILNKLKDNNIRLKKSKCEFGVNEITYLGYKIARTEIRPDPKNIATMTNLPVPKDVHQIRRFLGMTGTTISADRNSKCRPIIASSRR